MRTEIVPLPTWALCYLINGDPTGLEDDEIEMADNWCKRTGLCPLSTDSEEEWFEPYPEFGLACMVTDCVCLITKEL